MIKTEVDAMPAEILIWKPQPQQAVFMAGEWEVLCGVGNAEEAK